MADDIMISVSLEVEQALQDLANMEDAVKTTQASVEGGISPSVNNLGTKLQDVGGRITGFGNKINDFVGNQAVQSFKRAGDAAKGFATECVNAAMKSEQEWNRYGAIVNSNGGNWEQEEAKTKKWASTFSNSMGRANSDTRSAMMTLGQMGVTSSQMQSAMNATAGVAARAGITEAEASSVVASALLGKGKQLEKMTGLRMDDYKNAEGQVDQERLLNDIYNQNIDAINKYANSTEGQVNRINNSWGTFKKQIGDALLPVVKVIADVVGGIVDWFAKLPGPVKTAIAVFLAIAAAFSVVIGVLATVGPILVSIGGVITAIGEAGSIMAFLGASLGGLSAGFGVLAGVIAPLIVPILAVVAALTALYFIGIKMGWWSDLSGMVSKFGEVLGQVVGALMNFVGWFGKLFTDFPAAAAEFNSFVENIRGYVLEGLGALGDMILGALQGVWDSLTSAGDGLRDSLIQMVTDALSNLGAAVVPGGGLVEGVLALVAPLPMALYSAIVQLGPYVVPAVMEFIGSVANGFSELGGMILDAFTSIPTLLVQAFLGMIATVQTWLGQARAIAGMLVTMMVQYIVQRFWSLVNGVRNVFMMIVNAIRMRLNQARAIAGTLATMIRTAIVTRLQTLVARVRTFFTNVVSAIRQKMTTAVSTAKQKAKAILDGIKNKVAEIPDKVKEEFDKIKDRISSALDAAKQVAVSKISDLVAAVKGALGIASPGFIQRMVTYEFNSIPGIITDSGIQAASNAAKAAQGIVGAWDSSINPLGVAFGQFDAFNPLNAVTSIGSMNAGIGTGTMNTMNQRTINNNNGNSVVYHVDHMTVDLNNLPGNEKERFYNMLSDIARGA